LFSQFLQLDVLHVGEWWVGPTTVYMGPGSWSVSTSIYCSVLA